jgi:hypothetical protein
MLNSIIVKAGGNHLSSNATRAKWTWWFVLSAGGLLLATGFAKLISVFGGARILNVADPIFNLPFRYLMIFAGVLEVIVACFCLFLPGRKISLVLIAWIATNFAAYRIALWVVGWQLPCTCLGSLTDIIHVSRLTGDRIAKAILTYLLSGSALAMLWVPSNYFPRRLLSRRCLLVLLFTLFTGSLSIAADALEKQFEVEGVMTITSQTGNPSPFSCLLRVSYRDCHWAVFQTWEYPTNRYVKEISDDGDYIYSMDHFETNDVTGPNSRSWKPMENSWNGGIYPGGFPRWTLAPEISIVFYAYASACYLNSVTNLLIDPIRFQPREMDDGDQLVSAKVTRNSDSLRLPKEILFSSLDGRRTNAIFTSSNLVKVGGIDVPMHIRVDRYATDGRLLVVYSFRATNVDAGCSVTSFKIPITNRTLVSDYRFSRGTAAVPPIMHGFITNDWPTIEKARSTSGYKVTQLDWSRVHKDGNGNFNPKEILWFRFILTLTLSSGVVFIALTRYRMKKGFIKH